MRNLTEGNPLKNIVIMSIPIMLGSLFQQLYNTVDAIIVGRILGAKALAAVGSTSTLYYLIIWTVNGMANGFAVLVAQFFGAKDFVNVRKSIATAIKLCTGITLIATVISVTFIRAALLFMNTPGEIIDDAYAYIVVILCGLIATILYNMFSAILRAIGDSRTPFLFLVLTSILNVILDYIFIKYMYLGTGGAALATIISQSVSAILCAVYAYAKYDFVRIKVQDFAKNTVLVVKMIKIGIPLGAMGALTASSVITLQFAVNSYGAETIAAYTASTKLEQFANVPLSAYGVAIINFSGQNVGAQKYDNLYKGINKCMILTVCTAVVTGTVLFIFAKNGAGLFMDANEGAASIRLATQYLRCVAPALSFFGLMVLIRSAMQGMGDARAPLINAIVETVSRAVWTVYLIHNHNFTMLCFVNPLTWLAATSVIMILYLRKLKDYRQKALSIN